MNPLALLKLAWTFRKWIGIALAALAVVWFVWGRIHAYGDHRAAKIQAKWDADEAEENRVATEATNKAKLQDAADAARNAEVERGYQAKVDAANTERDRTLRLLQRARATTDTIRAGEVAGITTALAASEAGRDEALRRSSELDAAIADLRVEAGLNADQLDAVLAEIKPQL